MFIHLSVVVVIENVSNLASNTGLLPQLMSDLVLHNVNIFVLCFMRLRRICDSLIFMRRLSVFLLNYLLWGSEKFLHLKS